MSALDDLIARDGGASSSGSALDALIARDGGASSMPMQGSATDGMSTWDKLRAGTGMGMAKVGRAIGQATGLVSQSDIDEANRLDAALAATTPGKIGGFIGQVGATLPAALIPGAGTYLGAAGIGGGIGALTTEGGLADRAKGATFGAVGGAAAKGLGDLVGSGLDALAARQTAAQVTNAGRDSAAVAARNAGYVLPPADTNPTMLNELLNGLSGKIKTAQTASAQNQAVTNDLARTAIGAPLDTPLTVNGLNSIRNQAGQAYDAVSNAGTIRPTQVYSDALDAIVAPHQAAAAGFPNATPSPIIDMVNALRTPQVDAGSAVSMIRTLRSGADSAYARGDKEVGAAMKSSANALEDAIDTHLTATGAPADLLDNFRSARQLIAKTYSIQKGLNDTTGDVAAKALASQLAKGKPLSGDLLTIAQAASAFPKATQTLAEAPKQFSPLDFMGALIASSSHPAAALGVLARPAVRAGLLSGPFQRTLAVPSYDPGLTQGLLGGAFTSDISRRLAPTLGGLLGMDLANQ